MPLLEIFAQQSPKNIDSFLKRVSAVFSETIGRPEQYCSVAFIKTDRVYFAGSPDAAFAARITSIGMIDNERNAQVSNRVGKILSEELGVSLDRGIIAFHDISAENIGLSGTTYANILKRQ